MIVLPLVFLGFVLLTPWLQVYLSQYDFPQLNWAYFHTIGSSNNNNNNVTSLIPISNITYDPLLNNYTKQTNIGLISDFDQFLQQNKKFIGGQVKSLYHSLIPEIVSSKIDGAIDVITNHYIYGLFSSYDQVIINVLLIIGVVIIIRLLRSLFNISSETSAPASIQTIQSTTTEIYSQIDTIPICVGKGDAEELLVYNSYTELAKSNNSTLLKQFGIDESDTSDEIIDSFNSSSPIKQDAISSSSSAESSESSGSSNSPSVEEDSFERHVSKLDRRLSKKNSNSTFNTPIQQNRSIDYLEYTTSPSKKLIFKKSSSILTTRPSIISESTIGDITQETIYSEPFSSNDSSPLNFK